MGFDINAEAYKVLAQIEVGIREFVIKNIAESGITNWFLKFLGDNQKESIKEIAKRIHEANDVGKMPSISDIYKVKINKVANRKDGPFLIKLMHPFYYLNWPDLEYLLSKEPTNLILEQSLGYNKKTLLLNILKSLNDLRNDIAHSRFISERDLGVIQTSFAQISNLITDFVEYIKCQSVEDTIDIQFDKLMYFIELLQAESPLDIENIKTLENLTFECLNSFWVNSLYLDVIPSLTQFNQIILQYEKFRMMPGGLLHLVNWQRGNGVFLQQLKIQLNDR